MAFYTAGAHRQAVSHSTVSHISAASSPGCRIPKKHQPSFLTLLYTSVKMTVIIFSTFEAHTACYNGGQRICITRKCLENHNSYRKYLCFIYTLISVVALSWSPCMPLNVMVPVQRMLHLFTFRLETCTHCVLEIVVSIFHCSMQT